MIQYSGYQEDIFSFGENGRGHGIVGASAGSGKTSTLVELARRLSEPKEGHFRPPSITFLAFGKSIVAELNERLSGTNATAKTINSAGFGGVLRHLGGKVKVDEYKYKTLASDWVEANAKQFPPDERKEIANSLYKLADFARKTLVDIRNVAALESMCWHFDIELSRPDWLFCSLPIILEQGKDAARDKKVVDYVDQIWLPIVWNLSLPKSDFVLVDECLPYNTPVQLADGTSLPIGNIVDGELSVEVLAYDTATGAQRACKVTGWSRVLNQKPLVKIKAQWHKRKKGGNKPTNFVVCTTDHKVWADGQWIPAGEVKPGMIVQVETSAKKSQAYKITSRGKDTLSVEMGRKNQAGMMPGYSRTAAPVKRGGNGAGPTVPQQAMQEALGEGWIAEYPIATKRKRSEGYPTHYKADLANPGRKIVVELDGETHRGKRQEQDQRKDKVLESLGWRVVRFSNVAAVQQTDDCVRAVNQLCNGGDCPIDAIVVSVEPVNIDDYFVYDITVEDCHNFYANGILVHNCQDLSACQLAVVKKMLSPTGRAIFCGDRFQSIMGFSGADNQSFDNIKSAMDATEFPLSICYRCPASHIRLAQMVVPSIEARPNAPEGEVIFANKEGDLQKMVQAGDLIICRLTAPLIKECIKLIKDKVSARVRGRDIGKDLVSLLKKVGKMADFSYDKVVAFLESYRAQQEDFLRQKKADESMIESLNDRVSCLQVCAESFLDAKSISQLSAEIEALFDDNRPAVWLSTIHRAKGLEADRVFILKPEKLPLRWKNQQAWQFQQEMCLLYVALTRAKRTLVFLGDLPDPCRQEKDVRPEREALEAAQDAFALEAEACMACEAIAPPVTVQEAQRVDMARLGEAIAALDALVHGPLAMYQTDRIREAAEEVKRQFGMMQQREVIETESIFVG